MQQILYIHGMYSNEQSRKYVLMKEQFSDFDWDIWVWKVAEDLHQALKQWHEALRTVKSLIIIGDSAGGNLTVQLKKLRDQAGLETFMIFTNPLLHLKFRIAEFLLPKGIDQYFYQTEVEDLTGAYCLLSYNDEIIDHDWLKPLDNIHQIWVEDDHRFNNFPEWMPIIRNWLDGLKSK